MDKHEKIKNEMQKIGEMYISEIGADNSKIHFLPNKNEFSLDLRCGVFTIFTVHIDEKNSPYEVLIVDDTGKNKSKTIVKAISNVSDIEQYKDLIMAHLNYALNK